MLKKWTNGSLEVFMENKNMYTDSGTVLNA